MTSLEMLSKFEQLKLIRAERESLEAQEAALIDEVKAEMLSRGVDEVRVGIHHAKWTKYTVSRFNTKGFKADHEDLYNEYQVESEASRFTVR